MAGSSSSQLLFFIWVYFFQISCSLRCFDTVLAWFISSELLRFARSIANVSCASMRVLKGLFGVANCALRACRKKSRVTRFGRLFTSCGELFPNLTISSPHVMAHRARFNCIYWPWSKWNVHFFLLLWPFFCRTAAQLCHAAHTSWLLISLFRKLYCQIWQFIFYSMMTAKTGISGPNGKSVKLESVQNVSYLAADLQPRTVSYTRALLSRELRIYIY